MTSSVNPNNIDGTYPVAGQDNDSQGFRDNFVNTKNNFQFVKTELEDIQTKGIFKANLSGASLDNNFSGALIKAGTIQDFREVVYDHGTTAGPIVINHANGHYQLITPNAALTITSFSGFPASSLGRVKTEFVISNVAHTLTIPNAGAMLGSAQLRGLSANTITFPSTGTYVYEWLSRDGGTTMIPKEITRSEKQFSDISLGNIASPTLVPNVVSRVVDFSLNELIGISSNAAVTITYANITAGKTVRMHANCVVGSNFTLPNANNNMGNATIATATGKSAYFQFSAMDTTSANVFVFVANA